MFYCPSDSFQDGFRMGKEIDLKRKHEESIKQSLLVSNICNTKFSLEQLLCINWCDEKIEEAISEYLIMHVLSK